MAALALPPAITTRRLPLAAAAALFLALAGAAIWAQVSGDRGIAPVASSTDIEVHGIQVNETADTPEAAREKGWKDAEVQAWKKIGGPALPEQQVYGLVKAVIIEHEQLGPRRYMASLGVVFDRTRAGPLIGGEGEKMRSAPLLTLPVLITGGSATMFEYRNMWQRAWAEFQAGASSIDYVRPNGGGTDSIYLTYGQTGRRSRWWWAGILDQFGASDVIIPIARLHYSWPGGPVDGEFTARYGPDNRVLGGFTLHANNSDQVPAMLDQAVHRFDALFTRALNDGRLQPDPTLHMQNVQLSPQVQALIEAGRRADAEQAAGNEAEGAVATSPTAPGATPSAAPTQEAAALANFTVQVATPDAAAVDSALASLRGTSGVRSVATSSIAIGGTSVMRVTFGGTLGELGAALRSQGWRVTQGSNALAITR